MASLPSSAGWKEKPGKPALRPFLRAPTTSTAHKSRKAVPKVGSDARVEAIVEAHGQRHGDEAQRHPHQVADQEVVAVRKALLRKRSPTRNRPSPRRSRVRRTMTVNRIGSERKRPETGPCAAMSMPCGAAPGGWAHDAGVPRPWLGAARGCAQRRACTALNTCARWA